MKKPANLIYGLDDKPPLIEMIVLGLQHVSVFFISIVFPVLLIAHMGNAVDERSAINEFMEIISVNDVLSKPEVTISVAFDELKLEVDIQYNGEEISFPTKRPGPDELLEKDDSYLLLAGYLIGKHADRISKHDKGTTRHIKLTSDH